MKSVKMEFNPNKTPAEIFRETCLEEHILKTFILELMKSGKKFMERI